MLAVAASQWADDLNLVLDLALERLDKTVGNVDAHRNGCGALAWIETDCALGRAGIGRRAAGTGPMRRGEEGRRTSRDHILGEDRAVILARTSVRDRD